MTTERFIQEVETIYDLQPEYERGHDGSDGKCDCIGLIKGALRRGGETPTGLKGSNYAARYTLRNFRAIESAKDLRIGEAVKENLGITVEALSARLILPYQEVLTAVTVMEADGILTTDLIGRCALTPNYA